MSYRNKGRFSKRIPVVLAGAMIGAAAAPGQRAELGAVKETQIEVREGAGRFADQLRPILAELAGLGATRDDLRLIEDSLGRLNALKEAEMDRIIAALDTAIRSPDSGAAAKSMREAFEGQKVVLRTLRQVFDRLRVRQQELDLAARAEDLRRRQSENHHRTENLKSGEGDPVAAEAEQRAIEESVRELAREMTTIRESAEQDGQPSAEIDPAKLERMKEAAGRASQAVGEADFEAASKAQEQLEELLADLSAEAGREPSSEDFLQDLLGELRELRQRQQALVDAPANAPPDYRGQDAVGRATNALIVPVQSVSAPSGFQVEAAARAMRRALSAMDSGNASGFQSGAVRHLDSAIRRLENELEKVGGAPDSGQDPSTDEANDPSESTTDENPGAAETDSENQTPPNDGVPPPDETSPDEESDPNDEANRESTESARADEDSEALENLAAALERAKDLSERQRALSANESPPSPEEQSRIARETAELQSDVLAESPEAARQLGRAAVRMAEALDSERSSGDRSAKRAEAAGLLADATETILGEGKERWRVRNEKDRLSDARSTGLVGNAQKVDIVEDPFGEPELAPADRSAIEAARNEPVSPEYAPLVEAYFEKLSRLKVGGNH